MGVVVTEAYPGVVAVKVAGRRMTLFLFVLNNYLPTLSCKC
mgnify:CR=1 FL=1